MINNEAMRKIEELNSMYEINWGKKVDYTILPKGITQEKMVKVLTRIVDTGESILVAYNKIM